MRRETHVLVAVGCVPVTDTVDLDAAGVGPTVASWGTDDYRRRTDAEHIYAIGDVAGDDARSRREYEGLSADRAPQAAAQ